MLCGKNIHLKSHLNNMDFYRKERIAKLATSTDCDHDERGRVAIWIAEMAVTAKKELLAVIFDVNGAHIA